MQSSVKKIIKDVYKGSTIVNWTLAVVTILLCAMIGMTFLLPAPDARWNEQGELPGAYESATIGLKDTMLFGWHRPLVTMSILSIDGSEISILKLSTVANGTALNLSAVICLIVIGIVLVVTIPSIVVSIISFKHWKSNQLLSVMLWVNTFLLIAITANAIAFKSAWFMSKFVQFGMDASKLDDDFKSFIDNGFAAGTPMESVQVSYTLLGRIIICLMSAIVGAGGMVLCFGIHQRYFGDKKIVDANTNETVIVSNGKVI